VLLEQDNFPQSWCDNPEDNVDVGKRGRYCYGEAACVALAEAESEGKVMGQTIRNAETMALTAIEIALMRAYPDKIFGQTDHIRERGERLPQHLRTLLWQGFRYCGETMLHRLGVFGSEALPVDKQLRENTFTKVGGRWIVRPPVRQARRNSNPWATSCLDLTEWQTEREKWILKDSPASPTQPITASTEMNKQPEPSTKRKRESGDRSRC
jgi:hypothetical protein